MKYHDLVRTLAKQYRIRMKDVNKILSGLSIFIASHLSDNPKDNINLKNLGKFHIVYIPDRNHHLPKTRERKKISYMRLWFKPSMVFKKNFKYYLQKSKEAESVYKKEEINNNDKKGEEIEDDNRNNMSV
jgi:nucleoid DNA-binding protein